LLQKCAAAAGGGELRQAADSGKNFLAPDRDAGGEAGRVLCGRGLPPALSGEPPEPAVHRDQRQAEAGRAEETVLRDLPALSATERVRVVSSVVPSFQFTTSGRDLVA